MTLLADLAKEISGYAKTYLEIRIEGFEPFSQYGANWDPGEYGSFTVFVKNTGEMDVKNLKLHINGFFGEVRFIPMMGMGASDWKRHLEIPVGFVGAESERRVYAFFQFHATQHTAGAQREVLEAHISDYDVSFDHMLQDETTHEFYVKDSVSTEIRQP